MKRRNTRAIEHVHNLLPPVVGDKQNDAYIIMSDTLVDGSI
jgi:hypothetical protein